MPDSENDTSKAWPYWMLRHMMADDDQSFWDLVWSVGGSPPYGGISYEEAEAVYKLVENFRGKGVATPAHYEAVRKVLKGQAARQRMIDLFHCYDQIVSDSEGYSRALADQGLSIARAMKEPAAIGLFQLFQAGVLTREGKNAEAAALTLEAMDPLLEAAAADEAYGHRALQAAQNAIALTALAGDVRKAAKLLDDFSELLPQEAQMQLRRWIAAQG